LINAICDNALLVAYAASRKAVSTDVITEVARDLLGSEINAIDDSEQFEWLFNGYTKPPVRQSESKDSKHIFTSAVTAAFAALLIIVAAVFVY
jgi:hypothetical protein